jgi:DNA-binding NarL/FixJ family response regulator
LDATTNFIDGAGRREAPQQAIGVDMSPPLTPRQCQVLKWLAQAKSNKAIGRLVNLSESTVKAHLNAILRKTNTQNRTQAAIWAIKHGFGDAATERESSREHGFSPEPNVGSNQIVDKAA